ncbi:hypothetical protein B484DRAFT_430157 [Ochromonadaceae sp. CCMP2298]|nr:hypothetical protein B484DRAFT_430157 [Ochromonadaceae sp. CCMP2298]
MERPSAPRGQSARPSAPRGQSKPDNTLMVDTLVQIRTGYMSLYSRSFPIELDRGLSCRHLATLGWSHQVPHLLSVPDDDFSIHRAAYTCVGGRYTGGLLHSEDDLRCALLRCILSRDETETCQALCDEFVISRQKFDRLRTNIAAQLNFSLAPGKGGTLRALQEVHDENPILVSQTLHGYTFLDQGALANNQSNRYSLLNALLAAQAAPTAAAALVLGELIDPTVMVDVVTVTTKVRGGALDDDHSRTVSIISSDPGALAELGKSRMITSEELEPELLHNIHIRLFKYPRMTGLACLIKSESQSTASGSMVKSESDLCDLTEDSSPSSQQQRHITSPSANVLPDCSVGAMRALGRAQQEAIVGKLLERGTAAKNTKKSEAEAAWLEEVDACLAGPYVNDNLSIWPDQKLRAAYRLLFYILTTLPQALSQEG